MRSWWRRSGPIVHRDPFPRRDYPLSWVALAAAVAGVAVTLGLSLDPMENPDSLAFQALARSLLSGHGFRYQEPLIPGLDLLAFRAFGYPAFVALGMVLGGVGAVIAIQGALNGLSAALVGAIAKDLHSGRAAWIAFALRMIWPFSWFYSGQLMSETLYEFLTVLATWLVVRSVTRRQIPWSILAGLAAAAAILCRPVGVGLAAALGLWLLLKFPRAAAAYALAALVTWAPWPIRNARHLNAFVPFTTGGAGTAWIGLSGGIARPAYDWMGAAPGRAVLPHAWDACLLLVLQPHHGGGTGSQLHGLPGLQPPDRERHHAHSRPAVLPAHVRRLRGFRRRARRLRTAPAPAASAPPHARRGPGPRDQHDRGELHSAAAGGEPRRLPC